MTTKFIAAFVRLSRYANSSKFSLTQQLVYMTNGASAIAADATELHTWATEVEKLARMAHAAGDFDERNLLIVESTATEFKDELSRIVSAQAEFDDGEEYFEHPFENTDDWYRDEPNIDELLQIVLNAIESQDGNADIEDAEFWDLIDANFEFDTESDEFDYAHTDEALVECACAQCTADDDAQASEMYTDRIRVLLADSVYDLTHEAYVLISSRGAHPSLRNDPQVDAYASQWRTVFENTSAVSLAGALIELTDFIDDVIYALIAKNATSLDGFSARSAECLASVRRILAIV